MGGGGGYTQEGITSHFKNLPPEEGVLSASATSSSNKNCTRGHESLWAQVAITL